jgi:hypothetical protein
VLTLGALAGRRREQLQGFADLLISGHRAHHLGKPLNPSTPRTLRARSLQPIDSGDDNKALEVAASCKEPTRADLDYSGLDVAQGLERNHFFYFK